MKKKVLIVEDEVLIARDLKSKLIKLGYDVAGVIYNSDHVTDAIVSNGPDLILLDINIKGSRNGIELAHIINDKFGVPFIYVTSYADQNTIREVKLTAPVGYIVKPFGLNDLRVGMEMAFFQQTQNQKVDFPDLALINSRIQKRLSRKEFDILLDMRNGMNNGAIASKHFVSVNTIKSHLKNIYSKCDVHNRVELLNLCYGML